MKGLIRSLQIFSTLASMAANFIRLVDALAQAGWF
jgi:hypothetical protein